MACAHMADPASNQFLPVQKVLYSSSSFQEALCTASLLANGIISDQSSS